MTKFEDELRSALAADERYYPHAKSDKTIVQAAALLLDILPELRGMVEATERVNNRIKSLNFMALQDAIQCRDDIVYDAMKSLTEKLKKAGVV